MSSVSTVGISFSPRVVRSIRQEVVRSDSIDTEIAGQLYSDCSEFLSVYTAQGSLYPPEFELTVSEWVAILHHCELDSEVLMAIESHLSDIDGADYREVTESFK